MSRISRLAVLIAALASLFAVLSSTAGATTFTNNGGTNFHATGGEATFGVTNGAGTNNLTCTASTATGSVGMGTFTSVTGTITYAPCSLLGLHTAWACTYTLTPASTFVGGVNALADMDCRVNLATSSFSDLCTITGTTAVQYNNPVAPATPGRLTLLTSNTLRIANATDSSCSAFGVPTGSESIGDLSHQTLALTSFISSPLIVDP